MTPPGEDAVDARDLAATICALLAVPVPQLEGRSLAPR
jgi:hypothetical protein